MCTCILWQWVIYGYLVAVDTVILSKMIFKNKQKLFWRKKQLFFQLPPSFFRGSSRIPPGQNNLSLSFFWSQKQMFSPFFWQCNITKYKQSNKKKLITNLRVAPHKNKLTKKKESFTFSCWNWEGPRLWISFFINPSTASSFSSWLKNVEKAGTFGSFSSTRQINNWIKATFFKNGEKQKHKLKVGKRRKENKVPILYAHQKGFLHNAKT